MKPSSFLPALGLILILGPGLAAQAAQAPQAGQNITGTVRNGGAGQPAADVPITLLALQGGMQPVATTRTDAAGRYRFSQSPAAANQYLVQADFAGVPYFAQVAPGQSETNLEVFPALADESKIRLDVEVAVLQPDNGQLAVVDEYRVENNLAPKATLFRAGGLFRFRVPAGVTVDGARVIGPDNLPVERTATPTAVKNVYRVETPMRPGETRIQVSYRVPYPGLSAAIHEEPLYPTAHFEVYVPEPMSFNGVGFAQVGDQDGYKVYGVPDNATADLKFSVSGNAPMPAGAEGDGGATAQGAPAPAETAMAAPTATTATTATGGIPEKTWLESNLWLVLGGLILAAAAGFGWMYNQPAPEGGAAPPPPGGPAAGNELSRLKDDLFLLEVRKHTGNIAEAEYTRLRAELARRMDALSQRQTRT